MKQLNASKTGKTGEMPCTPAHKALQDKGAQQQAQIDAMRPRFTNGSAAKGK